MGVQRDAAPRVVLRESHQQSIPLKKPSPLYQNLRQDFGQFGTWERGFMGVGGMRGIGWVALTRDPSTGRLFNIWMDKHDAGFPVGSTPLLVMDVFEHAYLQDYGLNRTAYVQAFMKRSIGRSRSNDSMLPAISRDKSRR
ncbi:MAG: hypothetical protein HC859_11485 [Bacteroidia bacterium]|nr:hypothetical protein [Bacteroidia bacterium]